MQLMALPLEVAAVVVVAGMGQGLLKMVAMEAQALFTYLTLLL